MDLKFYLNKFAKVDNIEQYTYRNVLALQDAYQRFLEKSEGKDPDFPMLQLGEGNGKKLSLGRNVYSQFDEDEIPDDFDGIDIPQKHLKKSPEIRKE